MHAVRHSCAFQGHLRLREQDGRLFKKFLIIHITSALAGRDTGDPHIRRREKYSRKISHTLLRDRHIWNLHSFILLQRKVTRDIVPSLTVTDKYNKKRT